MSYPIGRDGKRLDGPQWKRDQAAFLRENPTCVKCPAKSEVVDHKVPHRGDEKLFRDKSNWQVLCESCHNAKSPREKRGGKKTDNSHLPAKLSLRRYMLRRYHADGDIRVLDCCQGTGKIWSILCKEFPVKRYWGLDTKPKPGRLKLDSARVLAMPGLTDNVIDIDTYGSPWKHWQALCGNLDHSATVFLTWGMAGAGGAGFEARSIGREVFEALGMSGEFLATVPKGIQTKLAKTALTYCLTTCCNHVRLLEVVEAVAPGNARYLAARLEPIPQQGG